MHKSAIRLALAGAVCLVASGLAQAQTAAGAFDGKKFFEEISAKGVNTKGLDANKFFEELSSRGVKMPDMMVVKN